MFDSIVALNMDTGAVKWATRALTVDSWNAACGLPLPGLEDPQPGCPGDAGPDYDFGQAPMLWKAGDKEFVGAGQKSGIFWALNPDTGAVVWKTQVVPVASPAGSSGARPPMACGSTPPRPTSSGNRGCCATERP